MASGSKQIQSQIQKLSHKITFHARVHLPSLLLKKHKKLQKYHPNISHVDIKDNNAKADIDNLDKSTHHSSSSIDDEQNLKRPKEAFTVSKNMATFTFVDILIAQKHFSEALEILDILEKEGKQKKKIKEKRDYIKNRI